MSDLDEDELKATRILNGTDKKEKKNSEEEIDLTTVYMDGIYDERNKWIINVKEKMNKDIKTNEHIILGGRRKGKTLEYGIRLGRIQMCEELLEESEK